MVYYCDVCGFPPGLTKKSRVLKTHYSEPTQRWLGGYKQEQCRGSGTARFTSGEDLRSRFRRLRAGWTCPSCGRKVTLLGNGKVPKHKAPDNDRCHLSESLNGR